MLTPKRIRKGKKPFLVEVDCSLVVTSFLGSESALVVAGSLFVVFISSEKKFTVAMR